MMYTDQPRTCRDCGSAFSWTAGEQEFYASRGLTNPPSRCPDCRVATLPARASARPSHLARAPARRGQDLAGIAKALGIDGGAHAGHEVKVVGPKRQGH